MKSWKRNLSQRGPVLTDLMLKFPFVHYSREFFDSIPIDDSFASTEVLKQAELRLLSALGRARYESHLAEMVEFSSFFVSAFIASQDGFLTSKFARREADRAREFFEKEESRGKALVMRECYGIGMQCDSSEESNLNYSVGVGEYLTLVGKYQLARLQKWKLVRQALAGGVVYLTDNVLNELFADSAQRAISDGLKNLRKATFPRQLVELRGGILKYVPVPNVKPGRGYSYIEELLKRPVADGRHRLVWLVLAPFLVNVRKLEEEEAVEKIKGYVSSAGQTREMKRFVEYNVKRAKRNGLMPPTLTKLRLEHPDLYSLLPRDVVSVETPAKTANSRTSTR